MKIQQKLFVNSSQLVDLSNKMHTGFAMFVQKASKAKKVIERNFVVQPAAQKTCENMPEAFCVLNIIQSSKEGMDPGALKQMTGFNEHKVHKILYKLFKHGEIRIEGGGLYTGVKEESINWDSETNILSIGNHQCVNADRLTTAIDERSS